MSTQSTRDLARQLDDRIPLLSPVNRSAPARHRTLAAALDWSIALLNDEELRLFRSLSVFRGRFDVDSALGIAIDIDPETAFEALISLTGKSLVFFDGDDDAAPYRLLDTTRAYAAALLARSGERPALLHRHVVLMLDLMKEATGSVRCMNEQAWSDRYAHRLNDVRYALQVCLTEQPDPAAAAALVAASSPLWFHESQVAEFREKIEAALDLLGRQPESDTETRTALLTGALRRTQMIKMTKALILALTAGVTTATLVDPSHASRAEEVIRTALAALTAGGTTATFIDPGGSSRTGGPISAPADPFEPPVHVPSTSPLPEPHEPFDTTPITPVETAGAPTDMYVRIDPAPRTLGRRTPQPEELRTRSRSHEVYSRHPSSHSLPSSLRLERKDLDRRAHRHCASRYH